MRTKYRIAASLFDGLLLPDLPDDLDIYYYVKKYSADHLWAKRFLSDSALLAYEYGEDFVASETSESIFTSSNLAEIFQKKRIDALLNPHRASQIIEFWANRNNVDLISTPYDDQIKFEDKIWFDSYLHDNKLNKPDSVSCFSEQLKNLIIPKTWKKIVIQKSSSYGSYGTYIVDSITQIPDIVPMLGKKNDPLLVREFIDGISYGITLFISSDVLILSPLRIQCFYPDPIGGNPVFSGIQWVPDDRLSSKAKDSINSIFKQLGYALQKKSFFGFANIDFILTPEENVRILECNPRLSSATFQLMQNLTLSSGINLADIFLRQHLGNKRKNTGEPKFYQMPKTTFDGCLMDIEFMPELQNYSSFWEPHFSSGTYQIVNDHVSKTSDNIHNQSSSPDTFVLLAFVNERRQFKKHFTVASLIAPCALFNQSGNLNSKGDFLNKKILYNNN